MKRFLYPVFSGLIAAAALQSQPVFAQHATPESAAIGKLSKFDQEFVSEALEGGMTEVKLGQLASEKGAREDVKQFGRRMVADHGKANAELETLAKKKGLPIPKRIRSDHAEEFDKLSRLSGQEFDKEYIKEMVGDHKHDVKAFETAASKLSDPELRKFADKTLPVLKDHFQEIRKIKKATP